LHLVSSVKEAWGKFVVNQETTTKTTTALPFLTPKAGKSLDNAHV